MKQFGKFLTVALGAVMALATVGMAAGCDGGNSEHTHAFSRINATPAGCTTSGNIFYYKCDECGKLFSDAKGENEITEAETVVPPAHKPVRHDAAGEHLAVSNGEAVYYQCSACLQLFGDLACTQTVTLSKLPVPMFTDRIIATDQTMNGEDVFASTAVGGVHDPIASQQFVLRFFMGFNYDVTTLKNYQPVSVHANIHRSDVTPDYWQFVLYYNRTKGVVEMHYGGKNETLSSELADIFKARNGFYFLFVRDGDAVHLYVEDLDGNPKKVTDLTGFSTGSITRMRIAHFEGYWADEKHAGVIKEASIALNTNDLNAERVNPTVVPPEDTQD